MTWVRVALAAAAVALAAGVASTVAINDARPVTTVDLALAVLVAWSFAASGLVAWRIRPDSGIGPAMIATSILWSIGQLARSQDPVLFTIGHLFETTYVAAIMYVLLAFPTGRLDGALTRGVALAIFVLAGPFEALYVLLGGHAHGPCAGCPSVVLQLADAPDVAMALQLAQHVAGTAAAAVSIAILADRWHRATPAMRFAITPVVWTGAATAAVLGVWVAHMGLGEPFGPILDPAVDAMLVAVAVSFLIGVGRTRLARSAVVDLMIELAGPLAPGGLRSALARVLHDPSLGIAYWLPDEQRFVDAEGAPIALPDGAIQRSTTMIERDGRRIAALIHDPAVDDEHLMRSACAAAGLALENERLQAELKAQLVEVRSSRARILEAAQSERRRIERDLHDGTQQRLVSIAMTLGLAEAKAASGVAGARELIAESRAAMSATLTELRELSQGIHPGILSERGLAQALDDLVMRLRMPVDLEVSLDERLPAPIETTAYYVVSEGLTNVAKYAHATTAHVRVRRDNGTALVEVSDDGAGGADPLKGSGLRGLRDRVEALGGRFAVTSTQGRGTTIVAELPCA